MNKIWIAILIAASTPAIAQQQPVTRVQTALNHLTVIEVAEPITMAAAGSSTASFWRIMIALWRSSVVGLWE